MKKIILLIYIFSFLFYSCDLSKYKLVKEYDLSTTFEKSNGKETATYDEVIDFYTELDDAFSSVSLEEFGKTDSGEPLHLVIFNPDWDRRN